jgi:hypothetical protein
VARGFSGTVHFTSSDGAAVLPPDYTFKENDQATARFQVTFQTGGGQVLTVNDTSHKDLQGQTWITVQPQTFNQKYVQQLYWELLGRPAETSGMNHWANLLDRGTPRAEVVRSIQQSPEFHLRVVTSLYATFLGREPDSVGRDYFTLFMNQGGSVDQAAILILSSTEYYNRIGGGNDRGYLACLYQDILHRPIDPAGDQYFGQLLSSGKPRMEIVRFLRENPAGQQALIQDLYQTYLKRSASTPEINYFFEAYKDGRPSERITSLILSGEEFLARIH